MLRPSSQSKDMISTRPPAPRTLRSITLAAGLAVAAINTIASMSEGFVGMQVQSKALPSSRSVDVAMRVKYVKWRPNKQTVTDIRSKSDEELHELIADSRMKLFTNRMDAFRKKEPPRSQKTNAQYTIAVAKTVLKQRLIEEERKAAEKAAAEREAAGEPDPATVVPIMADLVSKEDTIKAYTAWAKPSNKEHARISKRFAIPSVTKHSSPKSAEWAKENAPAEAETPQPSE